MRQFIILLVIICGFFFSCKKEYTQREKNRIEELTTAQVYKYKVPNDAFVFCLDTLNKQKFSDYYCNNLFGKPIYLKIISYNKTVPVFVYNYCGTIAHGAESYSLDVFINKDSILYQGRDVVGLKQEVVTDLVSIYYQELKELNSLTFANFNLNVDFDYGNRYRDSCYNYFIKGYECFIKKEIEVLGVSQNYVRKKYPLRFMLNLDFESEVIEIDE